MVEDDTTSTMLIGFLIKPVCGVPIKGASTKLQYFVLVLILVSSVSSQGVDKTRESETSGSDVVKATVAQIQNSRIFPNDNGFLRRLAFVESQDGTDLNTYRSDYHGGIWQVDEYDFNLTKRSSTAERLHPLINLRFKINWMNVQWEELRKPLYSALAASLFLSTIAVPIPHISDINGQAAYWKEHYDTDDGSGTIEDFVAAVEDLKSEECKTARLDIAFVVDSSGSITEDHFLIAREFISNIVQNFDIGQDGIRVGLLQYEVNPTVEFLINQHTDTASLLAAIGRLEYKDGGKTHTGAALNTMVTELFASGKGARNDDDNVPRIAIVLSDGQAQDEVQGPADAARAAGITVFAIGIGEEVVHGQLQEIANDPDERYLFEVRDFDVIDNIRSEISQGTCEETTEQGIDEKVNSTLNSASKLYLETAVRE
ncbi:uncharacterized protein, partial [Amphiura filiformis]|uniref:uncharacterized protein n=1 Tax=Amphiura filiformis TaxID=82378 RepID=UPI003B212866